ncbi:methylmalonyl Co-A mutase-associated GTPase MeaB [Leptobacterium flavescens]|uniref:Methylmalonyl Co-A mutase-associated GTPase MeaB n=1 Tax=Leptobacterium flavescens TaxID=472055 RepID=A0A6P0UME8_9FLAO|nr:methylmalonyl Co-A mutase-associated GTPase MeaB [Leptobacterium flavescens]NER12213.1 methylmalonyl Co-A mutase-associated GTPase MeaB [Leptobacterium flavescens]
MSSKKKTSALEEKDGVPFQEATNKNRISEIRSKRKKELTADDLVAGIIKQDKVALSRAITIVESTNPRHTEKAAAIIKKCLPYANKSVRVGITGVPGVGKSTFIEALGKYLTSTGKKVAVLAVDPSSSVTRGSILGDKTRMEELVKDRNAFIRPSASGDSLGGVARKTRESIILCEAGGYDTIIIETVGVGQSETAVHSMVDFFLLLKLAGAGDELQGIKRGIMEMADAIIINKADGENTKAAKRAKTEFTRALQLYPPKENSWVPKVTVASAIENTGIRESWELVMTYMAQSKKSNYFEHHRIEQNKYWLLQTIDEQLRSGFYNHKAVKKQLQEQLEAVANNEITPFEAARYLLDLIKEQS